MASVIAQVFAELGVSASLWLPETWWHVIHAEPNVQDFEYDHGVATRRWTYNGQCLAQARLENRRVVGQHAGVHDLFVPIEIEGKVQAVLVTGPFDTARPSGSEILRRWHDLTGRHGRMTDAAFARYVQSTFSTLTLEGSLRRSFEELVSCFADLLVARGDMAALSVRIENLRQRVFDARQAERMSRTAARLIDDHPTAVPLDHGEMHRVGLDRLPEHALVGLAMEREPRADPVDEAVRRNAFSRTSAAWARRQGGMVCGQLGDRGVVLLADRRGGAQRVRQRLTEIATKLGVVARQFGFRLHVGVGDARDSLVANFRSALAAAESAVVENKSLAIGRPQRPISRDRLRELRGELGAGTGGHPEVLAPHFERYVEAVLTHAGGRLAVARIELDAGFERLIEPLLASGFLEKKAAATLYATLERSGDAAGTVHDLVAAYRRVVSELGDGLARPNVARQERSLGRATEFIRERLSESISRDRVAQVAGFAPDYFSRLFKRSEGVTFEHYLIQLRLARAKQMLRETSLSVDVVQKLCGFGSRTNFHRTFKHALGVTPTAFREGAT